MRLDQHSRCGTDAGYHRHRRAGTRPCLACCDAHNAAEQARLARGTAAPRPLMPCGTPAAYRRHLRRGEPACDACRAAHTVDVLRYTRQRASA